MSQQSLARIPFLPAEELTILSMARWMRFIALITIVSALAMLFAISVALVFGTFATVPATVRIGKGADVLVIKVGYLILAMVTAVVASLVNLYVGLTLYQAADDFEHVVLSDSADQQYLSHGLERLKRYFQIFVCVSALTFVLAFAVAGAIVEAVAAT
jgi:hypothetical protein